MEVYRIHNRHHFALSGEGAARRGGRWNPRGIPVVYASLCYEGTLLETLASAEIRSVPVDQVASRIVLPDDSELRVLNEAEHPDWHDWRHSHEIGREWVESRRAVALQVPSVVALPWGRNVVLNPRHPDFSRVRVAEVVEVRWDPRLF